MSLAQNLYHLFESFWQAIGRRGCEKRTNFLFVNLKFWRYFLLTNKRNKVPAVPIKFSKFSIFLHFQGQNLNFLVKILIFCQKICNFKRPNMQLQTSKFYLAQIFTGFLLIFGQKTVNSKSVKSVLKKPVKSVISKQ